MEALIGILFLLGYLFFCGVCWGIGEARTEALRAARPRRPTIVPVQPRRDEFYAAALEAARREVADIERAAGLNPRPEQPRRSA